MSGHGWVTPNPDGTKARCGGPAICRECALEKVRADIAATGKADDRAVAGYCPMGCGRTLFLADGGLVVCSFISCPRRDAVAELLADRETEHIVLFEEAAFSIRHPLRERHEDEFMTCALHEYCEALDGPPVQPGRYRAVLSGQRWTWTAVPS